MKLFFKRHYTSLSLLSTPTPPSTTTQIIQLCRSNSLSAAIHLLNANTTTTTAAAHQAQAPSQKPILYATLIQTCTKCGSFPLGLQFHSRVITTGLETDRFVGNSLLVLYFKLSPDFSDTRAVFDTLHYKDVVSWTSMISGYVRAGKPESAIRLYLEMASSDMRPNAFTLSSVVKASSEIRDLSLGKCFHGVVLKCGFDDNNVIVSSLIDMYGRNHEANGSLKLFDEMLEPDTICWTSVISALTRNDLYEEALGLFYKMHRENGLLPDGFTFGSIFTALGNLGRLKQGKEVHGKVVVGALCGNIFVESSLLDMYAKCGLVRESRRVFDGMEVKNSVSWCALLGGYCQKGEFETVIKLFRDMENVDLYSFGTVLRACSGLAVVRPGKEVHCLYLRRGGWRDVVVESALVDLYAKCGCVDFAYRIFVKMDIKNSITWNSMISGFAQNGRGEEALGLYNEMVKEGGKPDYICFIAVLFACSHSGLVDQGRRYFTSMTEDYNIDPGFEHYSCMVDLLGRAGEIEEAETLIRGSEFRDDPSIWGALLGACTANTNPIVAERIAKRMIELQPDYHLSYVLLANVYRAVGRWNDALMVRSLMEDRGVKKTRGKSWIDS